jgi:serine/threonine protein kinase
VVIAANKATTLGRYQVIKHLAQGGMAEVFLARATGIEGFEREVVIKRIRAEQARDKTYVQMFLDEARLSATLNHHNIVQVIDIGEEQGEFFFAMEYIHGEDVRKLLTHVSHRGERVPLEHVITIVTAAAAGLHFAHEHRGPDRLPLGIVHRDVSPANILVGYDGGVKVADFGIAKAAHRTSETQSGTLKGKVAYMSPEQCIGGSVDRRSDVFALGIVLYELATVRRLFKGDNDFLTMTAIVQGRIPPPSTHWPEIPRGLEEIIMRALSPQPDKRFATADEMRVALEQLAGKLGLRTSTMALADYMKRLFSAPEDEPEIEYSVDFDGPGCGVVQAPEDALRNFAVPLGMEPTPSAPISRARTKAITNQPPMRSSGDTRPLGSASALAARAMTDGPEIIVVDEPVPKRKRWPWIAGAAGAVAAIAISIIAVRASGTAPIPTAFLGSFKAPPPPAPPAPAPPPPAQIVVPVVDPPELPADPKAAKKQQQQQHHRSSTAKQPDTAKKHWDPTSLFPK